METITDCISLRLMGQYPPRIDADGRGVGMKLLRRSLIALAGLPLAVRASRAQSFGFVWSEFETSAIERRGPDLARGLLLYFHGFGRPNSHRAPIPDIFMEMAKVAAWDVMRIIRLPMADHEVFDGDILALVSMRIAEARRSGYARIVVTGYSRGGWLALLAATLPDVDAVIGIAPGTGSYEPAERERTRDVLAQKLAGARAKRVAAFFFEGDPIEEGLSERKAVAVRRGLQSSGSSFMVVDRPPDLHGHGAGVAGRFIRRYRDCLLRLVLDADQPAGEVQCSRSDGYAAGAEIGFPAPGPVLSLPPDANRALAAYLGRWEGDDEYGAYMIVEAVEARGICVVLRTGVSDHPGGKNTPPPPWIRDLPFLLDEAAGGIVCELGGTVSLTAKLKSATELDCDLRAPGRADSRIFLLRKRTLETPLR